MKTGGKNITYIQYTNTGHQVKFIDTSKYYQQSLSCLASSANKTKKGNIRKSIHLLGLWLSDKRGRNEFWAILARVREKIKCYTDLFAVLEQGKFFEKKLFYSSLKSEIKKSNYDDKKNFTS